MVGAENDEYTTANNGRGVVYTYNGPLNSGAELCTTSDDGLLYSGSSSFGDFGDQLWVLPDMNSDGRAELVVGGSYSIYNWATLSFRPSALNGLNSHSAYYTGVWTCADMSGAGNFYNGSTQVMACGYLTSTATTGAARIYADSSSSALATLNGEATGDNAGWSLDFEHDFDGDGTNDALVGAYGNDTAGANAGAAYVVYGPIAGSFSLAGADMKITGSGADSHLGIQVAGGDMDNDGIDDIFVGAAYEDYSSRTNSGAIFVFQSLASGTVSATTADWAIYGDSGDDFLGGAPITFGDVDGDNVQDVLFPAPSDDTVANGCGAAWLIYGPNSISMDLATDFGARWYGEGATYYAGSDSRIVGDTNGDGFDDIVIAGYSADERGFIDRGAIWMFLGG